MTLRGKIAFIIVLLLIVGGVSFLIWNKITGRFRIGAEPIIGCQNAGQISKFYGAPGTNLVSYNLFGNIITVNQIITPYLDHIQKDVNDAKTGYNFTNVTAYNYRSKIGGGGRSLHSWGIAIDINPEINPYQPGNYGPPQTDIPQVIIDIFKRYGFAWGGDWPGERDAMHFEWYGARLQGQILDKNSSQRILSVATDVDGYGSPNSGGEYNWIVPFGNHIITAKTRGYKDWSNGVSLACYSETTMDIVMDPLPSNLPGSISGKVQVNGNYPLLMPATISLDGRVVGVSNVRGDYYIPNVQAGKHKVEAKMLFVPSVSTNAELVPGESAKNINIVIGK